MEERPRLVTGGYGRCRSQWVSKKPENLNFAEFLTFSSLVGIGFSNVAKRNPSFGKLGHVINPLTAGTFWQNGIFLTFWWF